MGYGILNAEYLPNRFFKPNNVFPHPPEINLQYIEISTNKWKNIPLKYVYNIFLIYPQTIITQYKMLINKINQT